MGSFYTMAAFKLQPRPVKRWTSGLNLLYDEDPNIMVWGPAQSPPLMYIDLAPPGEEGDEPYQKRYAVALATNIYNGSGSPADVTIEAEVDGRILEATATIEDGQYGSWTGVLHFTPPAELVISGWSTELGCYIRRTIIATLAHHVFSNHTCTAFIYSLEGTTFNQAIANPAPVLLNNIEVRSDKHREADYLGGTKGKLTGVLRPNLYTEEYFMFRGSANSIFNSVTLTYPVYAIWGEE